MSQWVKVPPGASGSSISTASSWVPDGGVLHCRRGGRFAPSQVNSRGNVPPARSGLVTVSGGGISVTGTIHCRTSASGKQQQGQDGPGASRRAPQGRRQAGGEPGGPPACAAILAVPLP